MVISYQPRRIASSTNAIGNKDLIGLLELRDEQTVEDVVKTDFRRLSCAPLSHACAQRPGTP
jgi:hypothetical protein